MKKIFLLSTVLMMSTSTYAAEVANNTQNVPAKAQEILFKIHDVKPDKDIDGNVTKCNYLVTFYNRTARPVQEATVDFSWLDDTGNYVIEKVQSDLNNSGSVENRKKDLQNSKIKATSKSINSFVSVPEIAPYTQVSVPSVIKTEKCFLLLGDVKFNVTSCKFTKMNQTQNDKVKSNDSCTKIFRYVSTRDPEYYKEFKPVSFAEYENSVEEQKNKELNKIEEVKNKILSDLNETQNVLDEIQ